MLKPADFNSAWHTSRIMRGDSQVATLIVKYEVRAFIDVRGNLPTRRYLLTCSQRIIVPGTPPSADGSHTGKGTTADDGKIGFFDYPVLVKCTMLVPPDSPRAEMIHYAPKTVNSSVTTSTSTAQGGNSSVSRTRTSGSSNSETNTYGLHLSLGGAAEGPTGSGGLDYTHAGTSETSRSLSDTGESGRSTNLDIGASMAIKDWACYASRGTDSQKIHWIWGQEFPWDVIQWERGGAVGGDVPDFILDRLFARDVTNKNTCLWVMPPSQLSLFGVDFSMAATWVIDPPALKPAELPATPSPPPGASDLVQWFGLTHKVDLIQASHSFDPAAKVPTSPYNVGLAQSTAVTLSDPPPPVDVTLLGLEAIPHGLPTNGAVIGFTGSPWITTGDKYMKAISSQNNLQVIGRYGTSTGLGYNSGSSLQINFKIADVNTEYALILKHWKQTDDNVKLTFNFYSGTGPHRVHKAMMERHVVNKEGEGGEDNLLSISLRNLDYTSLDCHDFLSVGMNEVTIDIDGMGTSGAGYYILRAIAIGEA